MRIFKENMMVNRQLVTIQGIILSKHFYRFLEKLYNFKSNPFSYGVDCNQMNIDICNGINLCTNCVSIARPLTTSYEKKVNNNRNLKSPCSSIMFDFNNSVYVLEEDSYNISTYDINKDKTTFVEIKENSNVPSDYSYKIRDFIIREYRRKTNCQ